MKAQDDVIDQLEIEVDQLAISMLGETTKPDDLRFITMAMRISNELERVGDEATTISRRSLELMKHEPLRLDMPIESMAQMVTDMLRRRWTPLSIASLIWRAKSFFVTSKSTS